MMIVSLMRLKLVTLNEAMTCITVVMYWVLCNFCDSTVFCVFFFKQTDVPCFNVLV